MLAERLTIHLQNQVIDMRKTVLLALGAAMLCMVTTPASAVIFGFSPWTGNPSVADQLSVDVTGAGGKAYFEFKNTLGTASSITDIYFYDGAFLDATYAGLTDSGDNVAFTLIGETNPDNLPGWNRPPSVLVHSTGTEGNTSNGIDAANEWLKLEFLLKDDPEGFDATYARMLADLRDGDFVIGVKVQSIGCKDDSGCYITTTPVPAAALLGFLGLGAAGLKLRRFV